MLTKTFFFKLSSFSSFMKSGNLISSFNRLCINQSRIRFAVVTKNSHITGTYSHKDFILSYAICPPTPKGQLKLHPCCLQCETQANGAASIWEMSP